MRKLFIGLLLFAAANLAFAGNRIITLTIANETNTPGIVFLGNTMGPAIGINGSTIQWSTVLTGNQQIGLNIGGVQNICYVGSPLLLSAALYQGDNVNITFGQDQFPTGIACDCNGTACST